MTPTESRQPPEIGRTGEATLVSVIIPAHNPGDYLREAIGSALAQSYRDVEVVVVDDGSTEDFAGVVRSFGERVTYLRQPNRGVATARNRGAAESRGGYLVFLDADDRLLPTAVEDGLRELVGRPESAFAAGLCRLIDAAGRRFPFTQQAEGTGDHYCDMLRSNFIWMPAQVIYRREPFVAAGGFDRSVDACADYDLYLRLTRVHAVVRHRRVVSEYRFHGKNMSGDPALMLASALRALRRQRPFVRNHPVYGPAYADGRRFWREYYGSRLVEEIRAGIKTSEVRHHAVRGAAILFRHHPLEFFRQLGRKARRIALGIAGSAR